MITTTMHMRPMAIRFDPHFLSLTTLGYSAENLYQIGAWLLEKIDSSELRKFPGTIEKLKKQHQQFMELYERTKIEEGKAKEKMFIKANATFYRPRLDNKNDRTIFERLKDRRETSIADRKNNKVSKVR